MSDIITFQYLPVRNDWKIEIIFSENLLNDFDQSLKLKITQFWEPSVIAMPLLSICCFEKSQVTKSLFCMHLIVALIKRIASGLLIMSHLGCFGIPELNAQISSSNSPWKYRATKQLLKGRETLDVLLVEPENTRNTKKCWNHCTAESVLTGELH